MREVINPDNNNGIYQIDRKRWGNWEVKICFTTALSGDVEKLDKPGKFERNPNYDYFLFTDIDVKHLNTSWDIIRTDVSNLDSSIRKSRKAKWMSWELFESLGKSYDVVFYCDAWIVPNFNKDWNALARKIIENTSFPFAQTHHNQEECRDGGILAEMKRIVISDRDTETSMKKTRDFFNRYDPSVDLEYPQYFENTCFGYAFRSPLVRQMTKELWEIYTQEDITYRDQPLWNFLLLRHGVTPIIQNDFKNNTIKDPREAHLCWFLRDLKLEGTMRDFYTNDGDNSKST